MELVLPQFGLFFWSLVIFLVFFFLLRKYAWRPILQALDEREEKIQEALTQAEKARQEIAQLRAQQESLHKEAQKEREAILAQAHKLREEILEKARAEAQQAAQRILQDAQAQIAQSQLTLRAALRQEAAHLAVEIARQILTHELQDLQKAEALALRLAQETKLN
ncbi:MAG: F0F1 ATP synthase subunit B [Bacteroidia bacterium]